jgi:hypothetical protein
MAKRSRKTTRDTRATPVSRDPRYDAASVGPDYRASNAIINSLPQGVLYSRQNRGPVLRSPARALPATNPRSPLALAQAPELASARPPTPQVQAARMAANKSTALPSIETRKPFVDLNNKRDDTPTDPRRCEKRPDSRSNGGSGRKFVPWKAKPC